MSTQREQVTRWLEDLLDCQPYSQDIFDSIVDQFVGLSDSREELLAKVEQFNKTESGRETGRIIREMGELMRERDELKAALRDIIEIGKRDMTNPKYDSYFERAKDALEKV